MVDIHLRACTEDTNDDSLANSWMYSRLNHIDNKANENLNDIKNHLRDKWANLITFKYNYNHVVSEPTQVLNTWYTSGGDYGYYHYNVKTPWPNTLVETYEYSGLKIATTRTNAEGIIYDITKVNAPHCHPYYFKNTVTGQRSNCVYTHSGSMGPVIQGLREEGNHIHFGTAFFNIKLTVYFNNGRHLITKTNNDGWCTIENLGDRNNPYRSIRIRVHDVHFNDTHVWHPTALPFGNHIRVGQNVVIARANNNINFTAAAILFGANIYRENNDLVVRSYCIGIDWVNRTFGFYAKETIDSPWVFIKNSDHNAGHWKYNHYRADRTIDRIPNFDRKYRYFKIVHNNNNNPTLIEYHFTI